MVTVSAVVFHVKSLGITRKEFIYPFRVLLKGIVRCVGRMPLAQGFLPSIRVSCVFDSVNTLYSLDLSPTVHTFTSWQRR